NAVRMTKEQITELVLQAREDSGLWEEIKQRELEIEKRLADAERQGKDIDDTDAVLDPPKMPTLEAIVSDLLKRRYGPDEIFDRGSLIIGLRRAARQDLGLPV